MIEFNGDIHQLKIYLKYLKRTKNIRITAIKQVGTRKYFLEDKNGEFKN